MKNFKKLFLCITFYSFARTVNALDICNAKFCECVIDSGDCSSRKNLSAVDENLVVPDYIKTLDLSDNDISSTEDLPLDFEISAALESLDLSANALKELSIETFQIFPNATLKRLKLENNFIHIIHSQAFFSLDKLEELSLNFNQLSSLPDGIFDSLDSLTFLDLSFNPIQTIGEASFMNQRNLKTLNLSFLQLTEMVPETFDWDLSITFLDLSHNYFTSVPSKTLWYIRRTLKELVFSGNIIESLPAGSFFGLTQLEKLKMEQLLYLRIIDDFAFKDLQNLKTLVLRYLPRILKIEERAFCLQEVVNETRVPPIRDLTIEFTTLSHLQEDLLDWDKMRYVSLKTNRWYCDCDFRWIKNSNLENITGNSIYCSGPIMLQGANLHSLEEEEMSCTYFDVQTKSGALAVFMIIIFAMLISFSTVIVLVYQRNGWLCNPPRLPYDHIDSPLNTITIYDRSSLVEIEPKSEPDLREMVYVPDSSLPQDPFHEIY